MKVLFLTTAHKYDDDRIFYHQALELKDRGFDIRICSLCSDFQGVIEGVGIESYQMLNQTAQLKTETFLKVCRSFSPDCIIASEPLAVIAAGKYRKSKHTSIIYDITEWYPSFRMLQGYSYLLRKIHYIKFFLIQLYAGFVSTHFIFGEESKKFPLSSFFPQKKILMLPYYPADRYIHKNIKTPEAGKIKLCYTGRISREDGIGNFFSAIDVLRKMKPDLEVSILIIGAPKKESDKAYFKDLLNLYSFENITVKKPVGFEDFTASFSDADLCFDLREKNPEYNLSLPIKLFYYIAAGKPIIYTDLEAVKKHVNINEFGYLIDPEDSEAIAKVIANYSDHPDLYIDHSQNARKAFEEKYSWELIKNSFVDFVETSKKRL